MADDSDTDATPDVARERMGAKSGPPSILDRSAQLDLAILFFSGLQPAKLREIFNVSSPTLYRAIRVAVRRKDLGIIVRYDDVSPPRLVPELGHRISARYGGIRVLVVGAPKQSGSRDRGAEREALWSDQMHRFVGRHMAVNLSHTVVENIRIGVGSGRGVFYSIEGLLRSELRVQAKGVQLCSLSGSFGMRAQGSDLTVMDSDSNVGVFALAFEQEVRMATTGTDLVRGKGAPGGTRDKHEPKLSPFDKPPEYALLGVGVAEGNNRLFQPSPALEPAADGLEALKKMAIKITRDNDNAYSPVADTCNRLFFVQPPGRCTISSRDADRIEMLIDQVNRRLHCIDIASLRKVKHIWMSAATPLKAPAVHTCLNKLELGIKVLCIDESLAKALIAIDGG